MSMLYTLTMAAAGGLGVIWLVLANIRVVKQFERGVVFRFGRVQSGVRGPGLTALIPIADRLEKVNMQIITLPVPAQDGITRDNVTVRVERSLFQGGAIRCARLSTCRTTCPPVGRSHRHRYVRSSGRAISTTCSPIVSG